MEKPNLDVAFDSNSILKARGPKHKVDSRRPYHTLVEQEFSSSGKVESVLTIFLANRECPFKCLMCDLWKNTTDETISSDDLLEQIRFALDTWQTDDEDKTESATIWKLYNSGNFFDRKAIPEDALPKIQRLANKYYQEGDLARLIVECHPKLVNDSCLEFKRSLQPALEIAMGLETVHPQVLPKLNKQMTLDDFKRATELLLDNGIDVRAFILLKTPWMTEEEGIEWAARSIEWAFGVGVQCCAVIPTRKGNGVLDQLETRGQFSEPCLESMETIQRTGLGLASPTQRLLMDVWDAGRFAGCNVCFEKRSERLHQINLEQKLRPEISCPQCK